jgi:hypothetical protein
MGGVRARPPVTDVKVIEKVMSLLGPLIKEEQEKPRPGRAGRPDWFHAYYAGAYDLLMKAGSQEPIREIARIKDFMREQMAGPPGG